MGQSAALYRVKLSSLLALADDPKRLVLSQVQEGNQVFEKTHEGLRYVLSKLETEKTTGLADKIFSPLHTIGQELDWATLTEEELETINIDDEPLYYHNQQAVEEIATFLQTISVEVFSEQFNPNELNANGIYPAGAWNYETDEQYAFNLRDITADFLALQTLFTDAQQANDCLLCFVG